ncbi:hypothetical protein [Gordonia polyisoprenivorans]|uniref:hypothetical protein n=1 Tax=Gordonia polyisoprenivorans TaxID=84595 RepID=UPI001314241D|nr:hypothetical protein [Gordonia polyisoprenivorans]
MAISKLESVPVDMSRMELFFGSQRPAMRRENVNGERRETPKVRDGVAGVEVDVIVKVAGSEDKSTAKFTVYGPVSNFEDFEPLRVTGPVIANVWSTANGGAGLWFEVPGIVSATRGPAKATDKAGA